MLSIIFGENSYEIEQYRRKLIAGFEGDVENVDGAELSVEQLPDLLAGVTLFSTKRLVVMRQVGHNKPVWTALGEWFEKGVDNDVLIIESNVDKRTKTYKWLEKNGETKVFQELRPHEASRWLVDVAKSKGMTLKLADAEFMIDYVGVDQWRLASELEKLRLSGRDISRSAIEEIVEPTPQATSFELLDAAFRGRADVVERIFETVSRQEDPYMFFGLIASQVYAVALMKSAGNKSPELVAKESGANTFVLKKVRDVASGLTGQQVKDMMSRLSDLDANIKSRGVDPWVQIRSFLNSLK